MLAFNSWRRYRCYGECLDAKSLPLRVRKQLASLDSNSNGRQVCRTLKGQPKCGRSPVRTKVQVRTALTLCSCEYKTSSSRQYLSPFALANRYTFAPWLYLLCSLRSKSCCDGLVHLSWEYGGYRLINSSIRTTWSQQWKDTVDCDDSDTHGHHGSDGYAARKLRWEKHNSRPHAQQAHPQLHRHS